MKKIVLILLSTFNPLLFSQNLKELKPVQMIPVETNFSEEFVAKYNSKESLEACEKIWEAKGHENLTTEEREMLLYCDEFGGNPWTRKYKGCSWYCGGVIDSISSNVPNDLTQNIHDSDFGTAWIVENTDAPNWIEYTFAAHSSRVEEIIIVNGYIKNDELFESYSRVKTLKMYVNNEPYAFLNLEDINAEQLFKVKPLGHKKNKNQQPKKNTIWSIRFEIVEVYKGKTDKIALTEIYFGGNGHE